MTDCHTLSINKLEQLQVLADSAAKASNDLELATEEIRSAVNDSKASGKVELIGAAAERLRQEISRVSNDLIAIQDAANLASIRERSRRGKHAYETSRERRWKEWQAETHKPSLAEPQLVFIEAPRGSLRSVYWRGKLIGYLAEYNIVNSGNPPTPLYRALNPLKVRVKKGNYEHLDDAVARLLEEIKWRIPAADAQ